MRYELINNNIENKKILDIVLNNRNINNDQVKKLLNANEFENPFKLYGINEAVKQFKQEILKNNNILIISDSDVDGMCSSTMFYRFLIEDIKYDKNKVSYHIHEGKKHGITNEAIEHIKKINAKYLIVPDAGTNNLEEMKLLNELDVKILVLDHHQVQIDLNEVPYNTVIVNNQINEVSKFGSGTLVTAKFMEAFGINLDKYMDLIAISIIADGMNCMILENRSYVNDGLSNIKNLLIQAYFNKNRIAKPVLNDVSFSLANFINAVVRVGTLEEKQLMFRALTGEQEEFDYTKKDGTVIKETLQERVVRISSNCKSRQNNGVKKSVELCNKYITRNKIGGDKVIVIKNEDMIETNTVGLVCMKLADNHRRPCIIVTEFENGECIGSIRAIDGVENFKDTLEETNLCNWVSGHQSAAGISINKENIKELRKVLNNKFKNFKFSDGRIYKVDDIIEVNNLNKQDIIDIGKLKPLWCSTCRESMFVIKNIKIDSVKIKMVGRLTLEFEANGIKFRKNWCSKDFFDEITCKNIKHFGKSIPLNITLVGKFSLDSKGNPFVEIVDANAVKNTQVIF